MVARFDDSVSILSRVVCDEMGTEVLTQGVIVRDAAGRLSFFAACDVSADASARLAERLSQELGAYARTDRVFADAGAFGAARILSDPGVLLVRVGPLVVKLLDRRIVGADWLRRPAQPAPPPPRFVFASLKGGVGRSTALSVAAADLAGGGRRVLAIDMDMEAPGLGAMLLDEGTLPEFGLVDALVENGLGNLDSAFINDLIGPSALANRHGQIDVVPAFGRRSAANPADVLSKIARAYVEDVRTDGSTASLLDQVRGIVDQLVAERRYDAVFVDSRAGLHESSASAILGLGAEVFLFGLDEPQTFQGYEFLFAHMSRLKGLDAAPEWVDRLTIVQGKAPSHMDKRVAFAERCQELLRRSGLGPASLTEDYVRLPAEPFGDVPWDDADDISDDDLIPLRAKSAAEPLAILEDDRYKHFEPMRHMDVLQREIYDSSYRVFLDRIKDGIDAVGEQ